MISVLIFDLDGTLIDSAEYYYALDQEIFRRMGLDLPDRAEYFRHFGLPHHAFIQTLKPDVSLVAYQRVCDSLLDLSSIRMFPKAKAAIEKAKNAGHRLGVLSSGKKQFVEGHLRYQGIAQHFEYVHGSDSSPHAKPDPRVFDDILEYFREPKKNVVYVGDMITDFEAATAAGIRFVGVTTGHHDENRFRAVGCETVIDSLEQLEDVLPS